MGPAEAGPPSEAAPPEWDALPQRPPRQGRRIPGPARAPEPAQGAGGGATPPAPPGRGGGSPRAAQLPPPVLAPAASAGVTEIDGALLEGGGQILRNSAALAAVMGRGVRVRRVRQGRSRPGLRPQHACGLELVRALCGGELQGCEVGSSEVRLVPGMRGMPAGGAFEADTRTAGSCTLMLQAALPCLLLAAPGTGTTQGPSTTSVVLRGGTDNPQAPPVDYLRHVLLPVLKRHVGAGVRLELQRRGFYPKGGGAVRVEVRPAGPAGLRALDLAAPGAVERVELRAWFAGAVPEEVPQRMAEAARARLRAALGVEVPAELEIQKVPGARKKTGDGAGLLVRVVTAAAGGLGGTALLERGSKESPEELGNRAAEQVVGALAAGAAVDEHMQDQLIIYMALARGTSRVAMAEPTLHTRTAIAVMEQMLGDRVRFHTERPPEGSPGPFVVTCQGAGLVPRATA